MPLAVEVYGSLGPEAQMWSNFLAAHLAIRSNCCKSQATSTLYGRLNLVLVRQMPEPCCPVLWQLAVRFSVLVVCFLI